jgi:hypothetical protein
MTGKIYHPEDKHPDPYQQDLNPDANAGQNRRDATPDRDTRDHRSAFDIKEAHNLLKDFSDDELRRIVVLPEGTRLLAGATYIDLKDPNPREFTANSDQSAGPENWFVPKADVDYPLWNRLIGVGNPERLDQARR